MEASAEDMLTFASFNGQPDWLLRRESIYGGEGQIPVLQFIDRVIKGRRALRMLAEFDVHVPEFQYFVASERVGGPSRLFTIVERVYGQNILEMGELRGSIVCAMERAFVGFLKYLRSARASGLPFWTDFSLRQFMYGSTRSNSDERCYMVDVEPYVATWPPSSDASSEAYVLATRSYIMQLMHVFLDLKELESRSRKHVRLKRARRFLETAVRATPHAAYYEEFRGNLIELLLTS